MTTTHDVMNSQSYSQAGALCLETRLGRTPSAGAASPSGSALPRERWGAPGLERSVFGWRRSEGLDRQFVDENQK